MILHTFYSALMLIMIIMVVSSIDAFVIVEKRNTPRHNVVVKAAKDFMGQFPQGGEDAFANALEYLSPIYNEEDALEEMVETYRILDSEMVRSECSREAQEVVDELWRIIKLMYNGSSLGEAKEARNATQLQLNERGDSSVVNEIYKSILEYLNPRSSASSQVTIRELKRALSVLDSAETSRIRRTNAQSQVVSQLVKVIETYENDSTQVSVEDVIKNIWKERENAARGSLLEE